MPEPTIDQKIAAQADYLSKVSHKLDAAIAAGQVARAVARADSADVRKEDDDARDARMAKMIADAVSAVLKAHHDDRRRDRHADDEVPPEECAEEPGEGEPQPLASDDDRLRREDDRYRDDNRRDTRADALRRQTEDENDRLIAQSQFEEAFMAVKGERAPKPIVGQSARTYRLYCLKPLQRFSEDYKSIDLAKLPPDALALADRKIRADAIAVGSDPAAMQRYYGAQAGSLLREIKRQDRTGRWISEFVGPVDAENGMFTPFQMQPMRARINMDLVKAAYKNMYQK